ncbi:hypothetical protein BABINDRAFT_161708 [Babjeviella inositovora NRRL Y-12698]|uniref:AMP-dependent synthetase/ligase domain-containing protein n=1 Tax=Babjeviella inositovora NRRL Y-12698 TaxID=984486 RepID=A0A1E3QQV3_9ASCO|nr:uncharacterized protein BABINDRAFT_161708 [Babjeviella inositovora NRRL Y-12698]ODQ80073.1 hypothetical protein BABINDRAFT_161708 [Babjeviella inositovora NRRL Y-12698]
MPPIVFPQTCPPGVDSSMSVLEVINKRTPMDHDLLDGVYTVPNSQSNNGSPVFRSKACNHTKDNNLVTSIHPSLQTIHDYFEMAVELYGKNKCFGFQRPLDTSYQFRTYAEVAQARASFGSGLVRFIRSLGFEQHHLRLEDKDFILTVFSPNTYEWLITDLACSAYAISTTTLYDTLGAESSAYILSVTKSPVVLLTSEKVEAFLLMVSNAKLAFIRALVIMDEEFATPIPGAARKLASTLSVQLVSFSELTASGTTDLLDYIPPTPDSLYTISFTSGTSGNPKGVELSQRSAVAGLTAIYASITKPDLLRTNSDIYKSLCILPLAHVYQRLIFYFELCIGGTIFLPSNPRDPKQIMMDIAAIKPTHLVGVPRIFNRIDAGISSKIESLNIITRFLYKRCMLYKEQQYKVGVHVTNHWLYDKLFTKKIKAAVGLENLQLAVTGSAPMLPETIRDLRYILNTEFLQGYGLTESFACISVPLAEDELLPQSSGYIMISTEFRLKDVADMKYTWAENRSGEILLRGPQMFERYYQDPVKTRESVDDDGWFHTGDIAMLDMDGRIKIIDRVKNFFKLSQGEYISPEKVENVYMQANPLTLAQVFVYGDSFQSFLVGVVVMNELVCRDMCKASASAELKLLASQTGDVWAGNVELRKEVLAQLNKNVRTTGLLNGMEMLKNIHLFFNNDIESGLNLGFTEANGLMTPTLKIKRYNANQYFEVPLKELYTEGDLTGPLKASK